MEIITVLLTTYLPMWAPALAAILGVAYTVLKALHTVKDISKTEQFTALHQELSRLASQNAELARVNKLLLDQITRIEGYADIRKED